MSDEGIGVRVVQRLAGEARRFPGAEFVDAGAAGMKLLHIMSGREKVVVVDCAFMGEEAGTIRRFVPNEVRSGKTLAGFSLHEGDVLSIIHLARRLDEHPPDVVIFGIEPRDVSPGERLSPGLEERLDSYVARIGDELSGAGRRGPRP
jgi:hydrogenase maturation protease